MTDTENNTINSICEFLNAAGTQFSIIDMGRGYRELDAQQLLDIEYQRIPAPFPRQNHMWLGVIFWQSEQHYIWFLKLPLDERGLLNQAARNHFLEKVVVALGSSLENTQSQNGQLGDNPYTFIPSQQQLSDFNARSKVVLGLPPSAFYAPVRHYVQSPLESQWEALSVQGLSDFAQRIAEPRNTELFNKHLHLFPTPFLRTLCLSFEHVALPKSVALQLINHTCDIPHELLCRALAQAPENIKRRWLKQILINNPEALENQEVLIAIAARQFDVLDNSEVLAPFFAYAVAIPKLCAGLYSDLISVPKTRLPLLQLISSENGKTLKRIVVEELSAATH